MGKSKSIDAGIKWLVAWHIVPAKRVDAALEVRGGDKTAWQGVVENSTTIYINEPQLFGGDTDQGGMVGSLSFMMGEADQLPNPYLVGTFGNRTVAWRGFFGLAWQGGEYGSNNPYPFKMSAKSFSCFEIWDEPPGWYPDKARIGLSSDTVVVSNVFKHFDPNQAALTPEDSAGTYTLVGLNPDDQVEISVIGGAWSRWLGYGTGEGYYNGSEETPLWWCEFGVQTAPGSTTSYMTDSYMTLEEAEAAARSAEPVVLSGSSMYQIFLQDSFLSNRGLLSLQVRVLRARTQNAMNPVHIIVHAHTHSEMGRQPLETINDASARAAADWYYAQGFGLNVRQRVANESPADLIKRVERVAGLSFTRDMGTGQWFFYVANGEFDLESLPILTDDDILSFKEMPTEKADAVNTVQVKYFDPERKETVTTPPLRALGLVDLYGEIKQTYDFPEIPTGGIANRVGWREALNSATPSRGYELVAKPTGNAYGINRGQYFRLQLPKRGIADMVCVLGDKKEGTLKSGALDLTVMQDVFSLPATVYSDIEHGVDSRPSQVPVLIADQLAFEVPYFEVCQRLPRAELEALPDGVGFLAAVAADPAHSRDFTLMLAPTGGEYSDIGVGDFCPTATVNEAGVRDGTQTNFTLANASALASVEVGDPVIWGGTEWCRVDALDAVALTITLGRACADTTPQEHAAGERLFFYRDGAAYDLAEHIDGEADDVKLLTNTGSQRFPLEIATAMSVVFDQRLERPYPPAKLRINGMVAPSYLFGELTIEWVHRDRLLQADQLADTEMASIGPEAGTTYTVRTYLDGVLDDTQTGISGTSATVTPSDEGVVRIEVESERDSLASWQAQVRAFAWFTTDPDPIADEVDSVLADEADDPIY